MAITGTPITIPAQTVNTYWLPIFQSLAPDCNRTPRVNVTFKAYTTDEYGVNSFAPVAPIQMRIDDLFAEMESDTELASVYQSLLTKLQNMAIAKGLI